MLYDSLRVEIADNPYKWSQGLMHRNHLAEDSGMIFKFRRPQKLKFWGFNTYIPLDVAFVTPHGKISQISHIKPLDETAVASDEDCIIAIEANMGYFADKKISVGDKIDFKDLTGNVGIVRFEKTNIKMAQQMIDWDEEVGGVPVDVKDILEDSFDYEEQPEPETIPEQDTVEEEPVDFQHTAPPEPLPDVPADSEYPEFQTTEQALQWAMANNEVVRIWYQTLRGRDVERDIEPIEFYVAKTTGNHIIISYDRTVADMRGFIISNILYYAFVGDQFDTDRETVEESQEFTENQRISPVKVRKR